MADVFAVRKIDEDGVERTAALKVIRAEHAKNARFLRMFSDEAKILLRLAHPNVVRAFDHGITEVTRFIVMEHLEGRTLADIWDTLAATGEPLSIRLGAWICARVAGGLHAAHELADEQGRPLAVVHRDVDPTNVFLTCSGEVKVIDFGLATARERREQTSQGVLKGKLAYFAPERFGSATIDRRVDVYALGVVLWEAGTMVRLFKRDTERATYQAVAEGRRPPVRAHREGYPDALEAIVERALQKDREQRYESADAMRRDLDAFVGDADAALRAELAALVQRFRARS